MFRAFIAMLIAILIVLTLTTQVVKAIWPPNREVLLIDGANAYAAQFKPKIKTIIIRPAPRPKPPPKQHRLKTNNEPFKRFEFDQRSIV